MTHNHFNFIFVLYLFLANGTCSSDSPATNNTSSETTTAVTSTTAHDTTWTTRVEKSAEEWRKVLSNEQYQILREKGTERPFSHELHKNKETGVYYCAGCDNPLFYSDKKFDSGTGWPSFWQPYFSRSVLVAADNSHGMSRDEVVCARCAGHLGHVFDDGPKPTGLRYCMNGTSLKFVAGAPSVGAASSTTGNLQKVVFAQGCFWCVEEIFERVKGVEAVISGYAGGKEKNPTYQQVGRNATGHVEANEISYNPAVISYEQLLKVYFNSGDITQRNGQGPDHGPQYRSIIFYHDEEQKKAIEAYIEKLNASGEYSAPIAVEVTPFSTFYPAEDYHQDYVKLHPNEGYVRGVSVPRAEKAWKKFSELLKE